MRLQTRLLAAAFTAAVTVANFVTSIAAYAAPVASATTPVAPAPVRYAMIRR